MNNYKTPDLYAKNMKGLRQVCDDLGVHLDLFTTHPTIWEITDPDQEDMVVLRLTYKQILHIKLSFVVESIVKGQDPKKWYEHKL